MKRTHYLLALLLAITPLAMAQAPAPPAITIPASAAEAYDTLESARQALLKDDYAAAGLATDAILKMRDFAGLDPGLQFRTVYFAAFAAAGREDYLSAHEWMIAATQFDAAESAQWLMRARYAMAVDALPDAALALTTTARRWPAALVEDDDLKEFVMHAAYRLRRDPARRADYLGLAEALLAARFKGQLNTEPDGLWSDLILEALAHQDLKRAHEIATRVDNTDTILAMRIDKRFDPIVQADRKRFDLEAAMQRKSKRLEKQMHEQPRKLDAFVQYAYALFDEGRFADVLSSCDAILAKIQKAPTKSAPYDDLDQSLNWVYNHKAGALRALGRWDEALVVMEAGSHQRERGSDNVSQAINLGFHFNDAGQPQKALDALAAVDWAQGLSPYGRMQLEYVRYVAYLQLDKRAEADEVLAYLRTHHADADDTWQDAMLQAGDQDGAAAAFITQLHDPELRGAALALAQNYPQRRLSPRMQENHDKWQKLVARADVRAAIDEVGRIERVPVYQRAD
jgi:hypothetical protein